MQAGLAVDDLARGGWLRRHERAAACVAAVVILLMAARAHAVPEFPFDAATYWALAQWQTLTGSPSYRGYVLPLLLMPVRAVADWTGAPTAAAGLMFAVVYGIALATLVPAVFARSFGARVDFWRRLVPVVLVAALFPGLLVYPLSDLPALLVALGALYGALRAREAAVPRAAVAWAFAAGGLACAAYNIRTIYLFAAPGLVVLLMLLRTSWRPQAAQRAMLLAAALAGALLVALPQRWLNARVQGVASFAVQARVHGQSLFATQLMWGLTLQRYETAVQGGKPLGGVYYLDPAGEALFQRLAPKRDAFSIGNYLRLAAERPLEFGALYARHVVNGLDVRDGLVYVEKPSPLRQRTAFGNFVVLALAAWVGLAAAASGGVARLPLAGRLAVLATLLLPVAAIVPGAVETRFFLPLHLLAHATLAFAFDAAAWRAAWARWRWWMVAVTLVVGALFFAVSTATMGQRSMGWAEQYRHGLP